MMPSKGTLFRVVAPPDTWDEGPCWNNSMQDLYESGEVLEVGSIYLDQYIEDKVHGYMWMPEWIEVIEDNPKFALSKEDEASPHRAVILKIKKMYKRRINNGYYI